MAAAAARLLVGEFLRDRVLRRIVFLQHVDAFGKSELVRNAAEIRKRFSLFDVNRFDHQRLAVEI